MARGIAIKKVDAVGTVISTTHYTESVANTDFDTPITAPSGRTPSVFAIRVRKPYTPQPSRTYTPHTQFPLGKKFHPGYKANFDYSGGIPMATLRDLGQSAFTTAMLSDSEKAALRYGEGVAYLTDGNINGDLEGGMMQITDIQPYYTVVYNRIIAAGKPGADQGVKYVILNFEASVYLYPGNEGQTYPGFSRGGNFGSSKTGTWNSLKGTVITCEHTTRIITLEALANEGQAAWEAEMQTRYQNRAVLVMKIIKEKGAPGTMVSYGTALYQGLPDLQFRNQASVPIPGSCDATHIPGHSGNTITLNKPGGGSSTYTLTGNIWIEEDFDLDYFYDFNADLLPSDFNDIFVNKLAGTQTYAYLWSKIRPFHTGAADKAHWQQIRYRMQHVSGLSLKPIWRQIEGVFEANIAILVNGIASAGRIPFSYLQAGTNGVVTTPKIMRPPVRFYNSYLWSRYLSGGVANSACRLFPLDFVKDRMNPASVPDLNHELHMFSALWQARFDLLEEELFLETSTLIEDPDVKLNATGSWVNYDGMQAFNMDAGNYHLTDGSDPLSGHKPAYSLRYLVLGNGDILGLGIGSHPLYATQERTDLLRAPGGTGLNGCSLRVKLRGESAHLFKFYIKSTDSNLEIACTPVATPSREMPGYGGWTNAFSY